MVSVRSSIVSFHSVAAEHEDDNVTESDAISLADHDAISWADNEETDDTPGSSSSVFSCCRRHWKSIVGVILAVLVIVVVSVAVLLPTVILKQENGANDSIDNSNSVPQEWGVWGHWTKCSSNCGGGFQNRSRTCLIPRQLKSCMGNATEARLCNQKLCPVDGGWTDWTAWSTCSVTCIATRNRSCANPAPANGGFRCTGHTFENRACSESICPVNGGWSDWAQFPYCCGGKSRLYRACNNPRPAKGGANCIGDNVKTVDCHGLNKCPDDCSSYIGADDGVYHILANMKLVPVFCEFSSDGAWTVIQRRFDGSEDFYRSWSEYKEGFGNTTGEYWLGNDAIHDITSRGNYNLTIRLMNWDNVTRFANYSAFQIASELEGYRLNIGGFSGDSIMWGDAMRSNNGRKFTTKDVDNDGWTHNCAVVRKGAWWYWSCGDSNLNGVHYQSASAPNKTGIYWYHWQGYDSLKTTTIMIKRL